MDPRFREDDGFNAVIPASFVIPAPRAVIPAEPALDLIGGQESIPAPTAPLPAF